MRTSNQIERLGKDSTVLPFYRFGSQKFAFKRSDDTTRRTSIVTTYCERPANPGLRPDTPNIGILCLPRPLFRRPRRFFSRFFYRQYGCLGVALRYLLTAGCLGVPVHRRVAFRRKSRPAARADKQVFLPSGVGYHGSVGSSVERAP